EEATEARSFYEKAFSSVYQLGDLYSQKGLSIGLSQEQMIARSTTAWKPIIQNNNGSSLSVDRNEAGQDRFIYNGIEGSDFITVGSSIGGIALGHSTRNDMKILTGNGNDIIVTGQDFGRLASAGQWDYKYLTEMGSGDDTLIVGASNSNLNVIMFSDGSIGAIKKDNAQLGDVILFNEGYNTANGGQISGTTIDMGSGNDTVLALGHENGGAAIINATIKLGEGDDILQINGDVKGGKVSSVITGDAGMDTLIISNGLITTEHFSGFEKIELGENSSVIIRTQDLLDDNIDGGVLTITGSSQSSLTLDKGWNKGENKLENDIAYVEYTNNSMPSIKLFIEEQIEII
ncbi:hypothetical protein J7W41_005191, partial [Escherichia coli]|nr:hypothetical protein [Escherichia coli]